MFPVLFMTRIDPVFRDRLGRTTIYETIIRSPYRDLPYNTAFLYVGLKWRKMDRKTRKNLEPYVLKERRVIPKEPAFLVENVPPAYDENHPPTYYGTI